MTIALTNLADKVEATVIVAQDGSGDYNGTTEQCIQDAIDSLGATGGYVFIKSGTYVVSNEIQVETDGIIIEGEMIQTVLSGAAEVPIMAITGFAPTIRTIAFLNGGATDVPSQQLSITGEGVVVDSCYLEASAAHAISVIGGIATVWNTAILSPTHTGIHVEGDDSVILNCIVDSPGWNGAYLQGDKNFMNLCTLKNSSTLAGLRLHNATKTIISSSEFYDDKTPHAQTYGIEETGTSRQNLFSACMAWGNSTKNYLIDINDNDQIGVMGDF